MDDYMIVCYSLASLYIDDRQINYPVRLEMFREILFLISPVIDGSRFGY